MPPSIVGRMGCVWADVDVLAWFDVFFQVKIFICKPCTKESFLCYPGNPWFFDEIVDLTENNYALFEMKEGRLSLYGLFVLVKFPDHYVYLLTNSTDGSSFFPVGKDLPEIYFTKVAR